MSSPAVSRKFRAAAAAVALLLGCVGGALWLSGRFTTLGEMAGAQVGGFDVDPISGEVTIHDIALPLADGAIHIGALRLSAALAFSTPAAAAENLTLQNVSVDTGGYYYRAAKIEIVGSSLSQKDLTALLAKDNPKPFAQRLAGFSAEAVMIPDTAIEWSVGGGKQTMSLTGVILSKIASGKAGAVAAASGSLQDPQLELHTFGAVAGTNLDLVLAARLLNEKAGGAEEEPKPLYSGLTVDKIQIKGANRSQIGIARLTTSNVKTQPGKQTRRIPPVLGTLGLAGATFDIPSSKTPGEIQKWTLKDFTLTVDELRDGLPTKFRLSLDNLMLALPEGSSETSFKGLTELGYSSLVLGIVADGAWNPKSSELIVNQAAVNVADMGTVLVRGSLGKFTKDVFAGDNAVAQAAFMAATVKTMSLAIENKGLFEHALVRDAKRQGKQLDVMRKDYGLAATAITATMLPGASDGKSLASAVSKFAAKPGKLNVNVKAKDPAGVAVSNFQKTGAGTSGIADKFEVTASAE